LVSIKELFNTKNLKEFLRIKCQDDKFTKKIFIISILVNVFIYWYYFTANSFFSFSVLLFGDLKLNFLTALHALLFNPQQLYIYPTQPFLGLGLILPDRWPFRSLPDVLVYFLPFYYFYIQNSSNIITTGFVYTAYLIIWNFCSCYMIHKITKNDAFKNDQVAGYFTNPFILMSIYLLSYNQAREYFYANINIIAGTFILAGIYFYYKKKESFAYIAWSIATTFKIFVLVFIIFFIFQGPVKRFVKNASYYVIPLIPNLVMFALWPNWIHDAWTSNWASVLGWTINYVHSGSIARELSNWFSIPIIPLVIFFCCLFFPTNFWIIYKNKRFSFLDRVMFAWITIILCIPDFVGTHNLLILGAYLLWISSKSSVMSREIKVLMGIPTVFGFIGIISYIPLSIFYLLAIILIYSNFLKVHFKRKNDKFIFQQNLPIS